MQVSHPSMEPTYASLTSRLLERLGSKDQYWVGVGGGPGCGKSTLTARVAALVNDRVSEEVCVVLPMDGYHYSRAKLRELDPPDASELLPRRGSPWTFDAEACYSELSAAKAAGHAELPTYCRKLSDPVPSGVSLKRSHRLVLVEGNYLLLRSDARWEPLSSLFDEAWFIECDDPAEQRRRLIARHLETWNEEKTRRWGEGEAGAAARADSNDCLNMKLVEPCARWADLVVKSV